ncbi:unnamed protein product [Phaedon cochleariae]|uniref:Titin n=1 Tax=Phaedon cochleariae TaxID=80249 RepID=A0A9P0GXG8_PHACE|nr:unnamed protein product [Phaedon cochleariae]
MKKPKKKPHTEDEGEADLNVRKYEVEDVLPEQDTTIPVEKDEHKPEDKIEAEITIKKHKEVEDSIQLPSEEEATIRVERPKKKPQPEEESEAEITVKKYEIEDVIEPSSEEDATIHLKKRDEKPHEEDEVDVEISIKKHEEVEDVFQLPPEEHATITVKKPKKKPQPEDEGGAELSVKKYEDEAIEPPTEEETTVSVKKRDKRPGPEDGVEAEITIKKHEEIEGEFKTPSDESATITMKKPKKKRKPKKEDEAEITVKKYEVGDVTETPTKEENTIPFEGAEKLEPEIEVEAEIEIEKSEKIEDIIRGLPEEETAITIKKPKKKPPTEDEGEAEITVKKYEEVEDVMKPPSEEEATISIGRPKKQVQPEDEEEAEITIKKQEVEDLIEPLPEEDATITVKKSKKKPKTIDDGDAEITVKKIEVVKQPSEDSEESEGVFKLKKPEKPGEPLDTESEFKIKGEDKPEEDAVQMVIKKPSIRKPSIEEFSEEITVKKLKPVRKTSKPEIPEVTEVETVTFRPRVTKTKEDVEQEFKISLDSYAEEEINLSTRVKLKKKKPLTYSEEAAEDTVKVTQEIEDDGPTIEEIVDEGSDAEEIPLEDDDISESFHVAFKRRPSRKYSIVEENEEEVSLKTPVKQDDYEEESITVKPKRKESVTFDQVEAVTLSITKEKEIVEEVVHEETVEEGDVFYSITAYEAEAGQAIDMVEGEKVYVIDTPDADWWFVKKHLTEESGWVPAKILMSEPQYTRYVQKKLNEKIDKLPVFDKQNQHEKATAPKFVKKLKPILTPDGYTVQFECQVEGFPRPKITWFRQTHIIKSSMDFKMYYNEDNVATLIIKEVFPEDAGTFTCVAKNSAGFASSTTELIVEHPLSSHGSDMTYVSRKSLSRTSSLADMLEGMPPTFANEPKPLCVPEGTDVVVEGTMVAIPEPEIKWYCNGKRVSAKGNVTIVSSSETYTYRTILKIKKVLKKQEGRYKIVAKNREGEASVEFTLRVITDDQQPPEILEPLRSITIKKSEKVTLSTTIFGNPKPSIEWFKNGKPIKPSEQEDDGNTYRFTIRSAKLDDSAEYTVKAKNSLGSAETNAHLTVEEFPENEEPPMFVKRFEEQNIPAKSPLVLKARVIGNPIPEVSWLRNNEPLEPSERVKIIYDGENVELSIKETDSELDSGDYKCVAINSVGKASHGAKISIEVDTVKFTKTLREVYETLERETIELECETSHSVRTKWWYNNTEISGMDHRVVVQDGRTHKLIIKNVSKNDEGKYKCSVKNQKTETRVEVEQRKVEFVRRLQDLEITEKDTAILEVEITSDTADVTWLKDGQILDDSSDKFDIEKLGGVRKLLIRTTSIHDEGEYSCTLVEDECKADVTVIELPPEIITPLQDKTVNKGDKTVFEIELSKGDALARWYKDGKEIQFSEHIQLSIDGKVQKLKIYQTEPEDEGVFSCEVGTQSSKARLTVEVPTCIFIRPLPEYTIVPINTNAEFEVELSKEDVEVTWYRQNERIKKSSRYTMYEERRIRRLVVQKTTFEDEFEYSCTVEKHQLKTTSKLKIGDKPSPPRGPLEISGMSDTSFTITWQASESDGGSPIIEYIVEMKEAKTKNVFKKIGATKEGATNIAVNYLEKGHGYKFRITARNAIGISDPYLPEDAIVAGSRMTPPSPPVNLKIKNLTSRSATLTWEPPLNDGGTEITGYIVEKKLEYMPKWEKVYTLEAFSLEYTFENLKEKSDYVFRVFAENAVGLSPPATSEVVQMRSHATRPSPPTPPLEIRPIGPNAVVVEWGVPESDGGAPLLGYNIAIRDTKKTMWMEVGRVQRGVQKFTVRELQEGREYAVRIYAKNEVGVSDPLEGEEPFKVLPSGETDQDDFREATDREPTSYSTETSTSWLRDNSMDADIHSYSKGTLLKKDEYFFRIWCYATKLFK